MASLSTHRLERARRDQSFFQSTDVQGALYHFSHFTITLPSLYQVFNLLVERNMTSERYVSVTKE